MVAKGGAKLLRDDAIDALRARLLPLAAVITPNLPEAEVILGRRITTLDERRDAARELVALEPRAAVVKGGHAESDVTDIFWDGSQMVELAGLRIATSNTHGSGCVFSAAITAGLARGLDPLTGGGGAAEVLSGAGRRAPGGGGGPRAPAPPARRPEGGRRA